MWSGLLNLDVVVARVQRRLTRKQSQNMLQVSRVGHVIFFLKKGNSFSFYFVFSFRFID
jgi:hypothetical protein